jgi:hypothetical protein
MRHARNVLPLLTALLLAPAAHAEPPLMRDFLGVCGHTILFRPELYAPVCTLVRDYHPVDWDLGDETDQLPEWPLAKNQVDWNAVYGAWHAKGFRTNVCLQFDAIAPDKWRDMPRDAASYAASFATQFGPSAESPLVEAIEIGNEPGRYTDDQYTALLRAVAPAVRAADAKLRVATCNLTTGKSHDYAKRVSTLSADPAILPALDVLTIHTYAEAEPYPTWRRSYPEDPKIPYLKDVQNLAKWRDQRAPGKAIWITEFGYDATTKEPDRQTEFAQWVGVSELQQAQYLVRSALLFSALPVERAYIYFFNDADEPKLHGSSGITRDFKPKPAYHALVHLQKTLGEFRFSRVVEQKRGDVYAYEFISPTKPNERVIVAWSPTGSGRNAKVRLALPAGFKVVRAEEMPTNSRPPRLVKGPRVGELLISESPLYVHLAKAP